MWWLALLYMLTRPKSVSGIGDDQRGGGAAVRDQRQGGRWHGWATKGHSTPTRAMQQYGASRPQVHQASSLDPNDPAVVQDENGAFVRQAVQVDPNTLDPGYAQQMYGGVAYPGFGGYGAPPTGYGGYWGAYNAAPDDDGSDPFSQWDAWLAANGQ